MKHGNGTKIINMIKEEPSDSAVKMVKDRFYDSIDNYKKIAPNIAKKELNLMLMEIEKITGQKDFFKEILQNI